MDPPQSRLPLPRAVVAILANEMMAKQWPEAALVVMLSFVAYLRPAEPFRLLARQVVAPYPAAGKGHQWWSVVLRPLKKASGRARRESSTRT